MNQNKIKQLETLRFIAFLFIFLYHGFGGNLARFHFYADYGAAEMVSFFFILSGFGTGYSSYGKQTSFTLRNWGMDIWKRIKKMYPLYFVTTVFCLLLTDFPAAFNEMNAAVVTADLVSLGKCLLLIQSWFHNFFLFNGVGWFLSTLLFLTIFALPMKCLLNYIASKKQHNLILLAMTVLLLAASVLFSFSVSGSPYFSHLSYAFPPARLGEYLAGICFGRLLCEIKISGTKSTGILFTFFECICLVIWIGGLFFRCPDWQMWIARWILPNFCILLVFAIGKGYISRLFSLKPFVWLGGITFECYLIHQIVQVIYQKYTGFTNTTWGTLFYVVYCLGITILLAALVHRKSNYIA